MHLQKSVIEQPAAQDTFSENQDQMRIVIVGHVDHGKSTLVGRLLYDTHSLLEGKYEQTYERCRRRGVQFEWAFLLDAFQSERDQNITIDAAQTWFRTAKRQYVIIDAPGQQEFLKNMITGAASADAAFLLIAANEGVCDQSRQHAYLLELLGISQVTVLVNKMDLVGYEQSVFERIEQEYRQFLQQVGIEPQCFIPVAARDGANITTLSSQMPWYDGLTAVEALDQFHSQALPPDLPLRFPVQDVYRFDHRRILAGRIEAGRLSVGDKLVFWPHNKTGIVNSIETWNAPRKETAFAGESVGITLKEQIFVERGHLASHDQQGPALTTHFEARVFWVGRSALIRGKQYKLKLATQEVECEVARIQKVIDAATLKGAVTDRDYVERNEVAALTIRTKQPVVLDDHPKIAETGRFVIVDGTDVAGGGITYNVVYADPAEIGAADSKSSGSITVEQRHYRHGHKGAVVWLTGPSKSALQVIARRLERLLFHRGLAAFVMDNQTALDSLNSDLGFSAGDRVEGVRRVGEVAGMFAQAGMVAITAFPLPYRADRHRVRNIALKADCEFIDIFVKSATNGDYEAPANPVIVIDGENTPIETSLSQILDGLMPRLQLPPLDYVI